MKTNAILSIIFFSTVIFFSCKQEPNHVVQFSMTSSIDSLSYSLGVDIGNQLKSSNFGTLIETAVAKGIGDAMNTDSTLISPEEARGILQAFAKKSQQQTFGKNAEIGVQFLAENAKKEGVITLPSGLQYKVITEGKGAKPAITDKVSTHYHGTLIDGNVFDSSVERGEPVSFQVNQVIPGWTEALQLMSVGSKWQLVVPYQLAYGEAGAGPIEPFSTLIFDVELLGIE